MRRPQTLGVVLAICSLLAAACGGGDDDSAGVTTLKWYMPPENSGAFEQAAANCNTQNEDRWRIDIALLPTRSEGQREQLVRRLAARDSDVDILVLDVNWTPEFAEAGWVLPWEGEDARVASEDVFPAALETARYKGKIWGATQNSNTQLLWYRKDRVPQPPQTWEEMVRMAEAIGPNGTIQVQGARGEGFAVWFAAMLASAGGRVLSGPGEVALGPETERAVEVMRMVATSSAADPSLSNSNEDTARLAFESGNSTFMVNYSFVWLSAKSNAPEVFEQMWFADWPRVDPDKPSRPIIGGFNLGVGAFSKHPEMAREAIKCLRSPENQIMAFERGGLPPTLESLYDDPRVRDAFPFVPELRDALSRASLRAQSPAYNDISRVINTTLHPPAGIDPEEAAEQLRTQVEKAIEAGGLL